MENNIIRCPKCGREYLPCEIYLPDAFLGRARVISRNEEGQIDYIDGSNMDLVETYQCDCGHRFKVEAKVNFHVESLADPEQGYISQL